MSKHPSLKQRGIKVKRNVLKRYERINKLQEEGRWEVGKKVWGLPKTKTE